MTGWRLQNAALTAARLRFTSPLTLIEADVPPSQGKRQPAAGGEQRVRKVGGREVVVAVVPGDRFRLPLAARFL